MFSLKIGRHAKEPMLLEMQELIGKVTFTGAAKLKEGRMKGLLGGPGSVVTSNWELEDYMIMAASVCKTWNQAYKKHLAAQTGDIFERVRQGVVDSALDLCDYSKYVPFQNGMPCSAEIVHSIYADRKLLFATRFKRMRLGDQHMLLAFYGLDVFPTLLIPVATVCCIPEHRRCVLDDGEFDLWRAQQARALDQWLGEQHAVFRRGP